MEYLAKIVFMWSSKSNQKIVEKAIFSSCKNVKNADKFKKFELLKDRFNDFKESVLKLGFDNGLKIHASSCININNYYSFPWSSIDHQLNKLQCSCSYCPCCTQFVLNEIAHYHNLENEIKEIRNFLRYTRKKIEIKEFKMKIASDWKQAALVLDRTFFFLYLFITIFTILVMFPNEFAILKEGQYNLTLNSSRLNSTC